MLNPYNSEISMVNVSWQGQSSWLKFDKEFLSITQAMISKKYLDNLKNHSIHVSKETIKIWKNYPQMKECHCESHNL